MTGGGCTAQVFNIIQTILILVVVFIVVLVVAEIIAWFLRRKGKRPMGKILVGATLFAIGLFLALAFWPWIGLAAPAMTAKEVHEQELAGDFERFDRGDIITIRDTIAKIRRSTFQNETSYVVWFESSGSGPEDFNITFTSDIGGKYYRGDFVLVFDEVVYTNNTTKTEGLKNHQPYEIAKGYQIMPSWWVDVWFWVLMIIGILDIGFGMLRWFEARGVEEETQIVVEEEEGIE